LSLNLLGQNDVPTILIGEAMDHNALEQEAKAAKVVDATQTINMVRILLCHHFEDTLELRALITKAEGYETAPPGVDHFMHQYIMRFYTCLSYYIALYLRMVKRSYNRKAFKIIKTIRKWTKGGGWLHQHNQSPYSHCSSRQKWPRWSTHRPLATRGKCSIKPSSMPVNFRMSV
jgi:hypothetical protein